jgi:hypothetical protein
MEGNSAAAGVRKRFQTCAVKITAGMYHSVSAMAVQHHRSTAYSVKQWRDGEL